MNEEFAASLGEWTAFYALMGGAAVTLLGLLFVAVSLRLNIFHQAIVEDIRDLAAFTLGTFLIALGVAALALAPHPTTASLAVPLALTGLAALAWAVGVARVWVRLNVPMSRAGTNRGGIASL